MIKLETGRCVFVILILKLLFFAGCDNRPKQEQKNADIPGTVLPQKDKPIAEFQNRLLDIAYHTATAIPVNPHIKDRSRSQMRVVETCIKLNQLSRALDYLEGVDNWRRGAGYADVSLYYARGGQPELARLYLNKANQISEAGVLKNASTTGVQQEWRTDHIRAKIAQVYAVLGNLSEAEQVAAQLSESESGILSGIKAQVGEESTFDQQIQDINSLAQKENIDTAQSTVGAYAELFDRYYENQQKRQQVEDKIAGSFQKLPVSFSISTYQDMAISAVEHGDNAKAIELLDTAQQIIDTCRWDMEDLIPRVANLLKVRFQAGQADKARAAAEALWLSFNREKDKIVNIFRAGAICPLAELYQIMGDSGQALAIYKKAVQEGSENPNSRPRAEDLSATCCSMAMYAACPDAELWGQIHMIQQGLEQPW